MKHHKDLSQHAREKLEKGIKSGITKYEVFSEEPYIQFMDGTVIWIDELEV